MHAGSSVLKRLLMIHSLTFFHGLFAYAKAVRVSYKQLTRNVQYFLMHVLTLHVYLTLIIFVCWFSLAFYIIFFPIFSCSFANIKLSLNLNDISICLEMGLLPTLTTGEFMFYFALSLFKALFVQERKLINNNIFMVHKSNYLFATCY